MDGAMVGENFIFNPSSGYDIFDFISTQVLIFGESYRIINDTLLN